MIIGRWHTSYRKNREICIDLPEATATGKKKGKNNQCWTKQAEKSQDINRGNDGYIHK